MPSISRNRGRTGSSTMIGGAISCGGGTGCIEIRFAISSRTFGTISAGMEGADSRRAATGATRSSVTGPIVPVAGSAYHGAGTRNAINPGSNSNSVCCDPSGSTCHTIRPGRAGPSVAGVPYGDAQKVRPVAMIRRNVSSGSSSAAPPA